jgi:mRNA interferase RelE/StbE
MARYELRFKTSVAKDLRDVPETDLRRILERIEALRDDPRPAGCEKLSVQELYRIRQGNYRILYEILDLAVIVEVVKIGHRREVYRGR